MGTHFLIFMRQPQQLRDIILYSRVDLVIITPARLPPSRFRLLSYSYFVLFCFILYLHIQFCVCSSFSAFVLMICYYCLSYSMSVSEYFRSRRSVRVRLQWSKLQLQRILLFELHAGIRGCGRITEKNLSGNWPVEWN